MSSWMNIYFMNANSPIMEQMIMFHDQSMILIYSILMFLIMTLINVKKNNFLSLNLIENQLIELLWTLSPMILLFFIAIPSLQILYLMEESFNPNLTMKITGHQWYWTYEFSNLNLIIDSFMKPSLNINSNNFRLLETDSTIYLPFNFTTRILVTSADVIHSWTIQSLGVKTDAIPGRLNQINLEPSRPGMYFGQCSEICGANHSFMPITLKISSLKIFKIFINSNH